MSETNAQPGARRRKRRLPLLIGLFVIVVAVVVILALVQNGGGSPVASADESDSTAVEPGEERDGDEKGDKDGDKNGDDRVPIEVASVSRSDVPAFFTGTAVLEAENEAEIIARAAGNVEAIHVEEGDRVHEGSLLLELDGREQEIALQEAKASTERLRHELQRLESLYEQSLASERDLIGTRAEFGAAEARQEAASLTATYTQVRSPFDGVVTQRFIGLGQPVAPGAPLFRVADFNPLLVRVFMPERVVQKISVDQRVRIEADAKPDIEYSGRVARIAPVVDRRTGTIKVTLELDKNDEGTLMPGSFVRVFIETDRHAEALVVPGRAVVEEGGESFVYRAESDSVRRVRVEAGYVHGDLTEILTGLEEGERVVTAGQGSLKDGTKVRIINAED